MADVRQSAQREPADRTDPDTGPGTDTADAGVPGSNRDDFSASDENELLDEDDKKILKGRRPPLKDLDPEQVGK